MRGVTQFHHMGDLGSIPGRVIPKTLKMVLDTSLLNTQQYKVCVKDKVKQSRERSSTLPLHLSVVALEEGAFWSTSTMVANFTYLYYNQQTTSNGVFTSRAKMKFSTMCYSPLVLVKLASIKAV